jgi:choice-of-anchor B domain-containing protein
VCFAFNEDKVSIVDVTDKENPVLLGSTGYKGSAYTHQGWLTPGSKFLLVDDELDEYYAKVKKSNTKTMVIDVQSLTAPFLAHTFTSSEKAVDHNQYITADGFAFQSNYLCVVFVLKRRLQ